MYDHEGIMALARVVSLCSRILTLSP